MDSMIIAIKELTAILTPIENPKALITYFWNCFLSIV